MELFIDGIAIATATTIANSDISNQIGIIFTVALIRVDTESLINKIILWGLVSMLLFICLLA